jgi:hypothetical protein
MGTKSIDVDRLVFLLFPLPFIIAEESKDERTKEADDGNYNSVISEQGK